MSPDEFARGLRQLQTVIEKAAALQTEILAERVAETARNYLGEYQPGWAPLKEATIARKATGDSPLLETGEMRDSIDVRRVRYAPDEVLVAQSIGSSMDRALFMEEGTTKVPPRPFLSLALAEHEMDITESLDDVIGEAIDVALGLK